MSNLFIYDFSAGVNYSLSKMVLGLTTQPLAWADSKNVELHNDKGLCRMKGNCTVVNTPDDASVLGMYEYAKGNDKYLVVNTAAGNFYYYDEDYNSLILKKSGLSTTAIPSYTNYLDGVICSNGVDEPFYFEKGAEEEIQSCNAVDSNGEYIRGTAITSYKSRLWIGSKGKLYYSALGRFDDWTTSGDAGYINNFYNDSSSIIALDKYKDYMSIYKSEQTYLLSGMTYADFTVKPFTNIGSVSSKGVVTVNNKQFFFNNGVFNLEDTGVLSQITLSSELSLNIHSEFSKIDKSRLKEVVVVTYEPKKQIWFYLPYQNEDYLKNCWIYDYKNVCWFKRTVPQDITCAVCFKGNVLTATKDGKILKEDFGSDFDGQAIDFYWKSPFLALGDPNVKKTVDEFYVAVDDSFDNNFKISVLTNYNDDTESDLQLINTAGANDLIWDAEENLWASEDESVGKSWAKLIEVTERIASFDSAKSVQFKISGGTPQNDFAVIGLEFKDIVNDET